MVARALVIALAALLPAAAHAVKCPAELPVLFISQDKSGTMAEPPDPACPSCPSKWATAKGAVTSLSQKYANRFRFGVQMYPHDTTTFNCTTGTTVTPFPASTDAISVAYASAAPGGGTPTAASLDAAVAYLESLHLAEPAYVLLLTDGLPNCNLALNPTTCSPSQPACTDASGVGSPNCGAKGCLDDQGAKAAAARALAAGYKVYVVGFDAALNVNKAVLDAIALAGGTGHSYTATDPVSLDAALGAIAVDATTCCKDVCVNGQAQCTSTGQLQRCQLDAQGECTNWTTSTCPPSSTCTNGTCFTCTNECTAGAVRCSGSTSQKCLAQAGGCTKWTTIEDCGWGEICASGLCQSCSSTCSAGARRCSGADTQTCELDLLSGCTDWATAKCAAGSTCQGGACLSCSQTCKAGEKRCNGKTVESCAADALGCTRWQPGLTCTDFCSGGACGACGTTCSLGEKRCNGNSAETCGQDANGCTVWTGGACAADQYCALGSCQACPARCNPGDRQCAANGTILECRAQPNGCYDWAGVSTCLAGEICSAGKCAPPCKSECSQGEAKCDAQGAPTTCEKAPTGCWVWKSAARCAGTDACVQGACRKPCTGDEIESCPTGFVCTGTVDGKFCLPADAPDAGAPSVPTLPGAEDPVEQPGGKPAAPAGEATANGGCGCSAPGASPAILAALPILAGLLRRRRRA